MCGHSHCGAVKGLMHSPSVAALPLVRELAHLGRTSPPAATGPEQAGSGQTSAPDEDTVHVTQRHLVTQLDHLRTYPDIAQRLAAGRLRLDTAGTHRGQRAKSPEGGPGFVKNSGRCDAPSDRASTSDAPPAGLDSDVPAHTACSLDLDCTYQREPSMAHRSASLWKARRTDGGVSRRLPRRPASVCRDCRGLRSAGRSWPHHRGGSSAGW